MLRVVEREREGGGEEITVRCKVNLMMMLLFMLQTLRGKVRLYVCKSSSFYDTPSG